MFSVFALVSTFLVMFVPSEFDGCPAQPIKHPELVTLLLIVSEFVRVIYETESDLFLVGLVNAHVASHLSTRVDGSSCSAGVFSASLFIIAACLCVHFGRSWASDGKQPVSRERPAENNLNI